MESSTTTSDCHIDDDAIPDDAIDTLVIELARHLAEREHERQQPDAEG